MRVGPVGSPIFKLLLVLGLLLTGCTDRNMQIEFLSKNLLTSYQFEVTNSINQTDIAPVNAKLPFEVECGKSITAVEVFDATVQSYKPIGELDATAQINCATDGSAQFALTMEQVGAVENPQTPGDQRRNIELRLTVQNITGAISQYTKSYSAFFQAPTVTVSSAPNVNAASATGAAGTTYTVSGTCTFDGGSVKVEAPFANPETTACASGVFNAALTLNTALTDGSVSVSVDHSASGVFYAYGNVAQTIVVDRTVPALAITSPGTATTLNAAAAPGGKFTVNGSCETGLDVTLTMASSSTVTACAGGNFSAALDVIEGAISVVASQTDAAGNSGNATVSFNIDTIGPGAFSISGIRATSSATTSDLVVDNILTEAGPQVHYLAAAGADDGYEIYIRESIAGAGLGTLVCSNTAVASGGTSADLPSCAVTQLTHGTAYRIYMKAKDPHGNTTEASNNGYQFTVQYPTPQITQVVTVLAAGNIVSNYLQASAVLRFDLKYDRPITITGTPSVRVNVVSGGKKIMGSQFDSKTLRFSYTVEANEYSTNLQFTELLVRDITAVDAVTGRPASFAIPATAFSEKVDTIIPGTVTGFAVKDPAVSLSKSGVITYVRPADNDQSALNIRMEVVDAGTVIHTQDGFVSGTRLLGISPALTLNATYRLRATVIDPAGNESTATEIDYAASPCPEGFVLINHASAPAGGTITPFCAGSTEAKIDGTSVVFRAAGVPISEITYGDAVAQCAGINRSGYSGDYDLISNREWNTLTHLISNSTSNWSGGGIGSGVIYWGYTDNAFHQTAAINEADPCQSPTTTGCTDVRKRRYHVIQYNQKIWDLSGNLFEFVKGPSTAGNDLTLYNTLNATLEYLMANASGAPILTPYGGAPTCSTNTSPYCGYGSISFYCSEQSGASGASSCSASPLGAVDVTRSYVLRGGAATSQTAAGIFAATRYAGSSDIFSNAGYRCSYHPL